MALFLICGCSSGGGGNPASPPLLTDAAFTPTQTDRGGSTGPAIPVEPKLGWQITEPAELLEEGWGRFPATLSDSILLSAYLYGTKADEFVGDVTLTVDGQPHPFSFNRKTLTAQIAGLKQGRHHIHLLAGSQVGCAQRSFRFTKVNSQPWMQVGIGEDDGKVYAVLSRPMPTSQLADISRWTCQKFNADKIDIEILSDNRTAVLTMSNYVPLDDYSWLPIDGSSPFVRFNSSLGEVTGKLFNDVEDAGSGSRGGQTIDGCDEGDTYNHRSAGYCDTPYGWTLERDHLVSSDSEPRAAFNTEVPIAVMGWPPWWYPWRDCYNLIIVRFNSVQEASLDPLNNWNDQYDDVWHSSQADPYFGVGFQDWAVQLYERDHSYFSPSWCSYGWWSHEVDGNWCDPEIPVGFKSKGSWNGPGFDSGPILVDHDPPYFGDDENNHYEGIDLMLGSELDEFTDTYITALYSELLTNGNLYKSNGNPVNDQEDFWQYYWDAVGQSVADDQLCIVVRGQDLESDSGRYISNQLSLDYTYLGQNYADDNAAEHLFYVDSSPFYPDELTSQAWPYLIGDELVSMRLPTDGVAQGEYSVWILAADCNLLNGDISSFRVRLTDDTNNWRRSPEFITEIPELEIVQPSGCGETEEDRCDYCCGSTVLFEAAITGADYTEDLEQLIDWFVLQDDGQGGWIELDYDDYQASEFLSIVQEAPWRGPTFTVNNILDLEFQVRAKIEACGDTYSDDCFVKDPPYIEGLMFRGERYPDPDMWQDQHHWDYDAEKTPKDDNTGTPDMRASFASPGDGYIIPRFCGEEITLPVYAILRGRDDKHYIKIKIEAEWDLPWSEHDTIDPLKLWELDKNDPANKDFIDEILAEFFGYEEILGEDLTNIYVYGRGPHAYTTNPGPPVLPDFVYLTDDLGKKDATSPHLYLYVSNDDDHMDFSTLTAVDGVVDSTAMQDAYEHKKIVQPLQYGYERGDFYWNKYNVDGEGQNNYRENVLMMGHEVVTAFWDGSTTNRYARIPIQSFPDIAFFTAHGKFVDEDMLGCPVFHSGVTIDEHMVSLNCWPSQPGQPEEEADGQISPYDIMISCPANDPGDPDNHYSETKWIAILACEALHIAVECESEKHQSDLTNTYEGWDDWQNIIGSGNSSIEAVVGFREDVPVVWQMKQFAQDVGHDLEEGSYFGGGWDGLHPEYWDDDFEDYWKDFGQDWEQGWFGFNEDTNVNKVVVVWMESAVAGLCLNWFWSVPSIGVTATAIVKNGNQVQVWIVHNAGTPKHPKWEITAYREDFWDKS